MQLKRLVYQRDELPHITLEFDRSIKGYHKALVNVIRKQAESACNSVFTATRTGKHRYHIVDTSDYETTYEVVIKPKEKSITVICLTDTLFLATDHTLRIASRDLGEYVWKTIGREEE